MSQNFEFKFPLQSRILSLGYVLRFLKSVTLTGFHISFSLQLATLCITNSHVELPLTETGSLEFSG